MAVEDVIRAIRHAKKELETYPRRETWYETSTRYAIVDPILWSLGWRTHKSKECEVEFPIGKKIVRWVDYALLDSNQIIVALVESKAARECLSGHVAQLAWYSRIAQMREGVAVLTNGIEWRLYNLSERGHFGNKLIKSVDLVNDPPEDVANFLLHWLNKNKWWTQPSPDGGPKCPSD